LWRERRVWSPDASGGLVNGRRRMHARVCVGVGVGTIGVVLHAHTHRHTHARAAGGRVLCLRRLFAVRAKAPQQPPLSTTQHSTPRSHH
jgi:integrase